MFTEHVKLAFKEACIWTHVCVDDFSFWCLQIETYQNITSISLLIVRLSGYDLNNIKKFYLIRCWFTLPHNSLQYDCNYTVSFQPISYMKSLWKKDIRASEYIFPWLKTELDWFLKQYLEPGSPQDRSLH